MIAAAQLPAHPGMFLGILALVFLVDLAMIAALGLPLLRRGRRHD